MRERVSWSHDKFSIYCEGICLTTLSYESSSSSSHPSNPSSRLNLSRNKPWSGREPIKSLNEHHISITISITFLLSTAGFEGEDLDESSIVRSCIFIYLLVRAHLLLASEYEVSYGSPCIRIITPLISIELFVILNNIYRYLKRDLSILKMYNNAH